jgi:hypothetical protein
MTVASRPEYTSQATQIEQARAAHDVMVAMEAAKKWRRDLPQVRQDMLAVCQTERVAKTAFWSLPRGDKKLTGSSVQLMRTIAAIFGNMDVGARQLDRNERGRFSEMQAWAWDLQSNFRIAETFIVPWIVDLRNEGSRPAKSEREIRELLSAVAQRKVRVQIANVLPDWYVAEAEDTAMAVIEQRGVPIEKVRADTAKLLDPLGVQMPNVLYRVGRDKWSDTLRGDLAVLRIAADQILRGEASVADLFPPPPKPGTPFVPEVGAKPIAEQTPAVDTAPSEDLLGEKPKLTPKTRRELMALCTEAGLDPRKDRDRRLRLFEILGDLSEPLTSGDLLTEEDGQRIAELLRARGDSVKAFVEQTLRKDDEERARDLVEAAEDAPPEAPEEESS